ncbi:MAG TPA: phosphate signaling complex protein PhoU [Bryobacteraceae bacterium]|nr:phosphate signaling complex protein PhoU [Bryobacteraceae bacterium]
MRHFSLELEGLHERLLQMGGLVESAIRKSIRSLVDRDKNVADQVFQDEERINQLEIEIDNLGTRLLALHQPVARDLRFLTAALKINTDLERMGDLAVNITERALSLMALPPIKPLIDIPKMASLVEAMLLRSLDAFVKSDAEIARTVLFSDDEVDALRDAIYKELVTFMQQDSSNVQCAVDLMFVARDLERIADHATNIAEDVVYLVQGIDIRHRALEAR